MTSGKTLNQETPFSEPWQAQLFALTIALNDQGVFSWEEWVDHFSKYTSTENSINTENDYYNLWLKAFEEFTPVVSIQNLS